MIYIERKEKETAEALIRRFSRRVQQSGVLKHVRKLRFRAEEQSRPKRRDEALYKVKIRKEINRLKKLGRFDDEALRDIKKKIR